MSYRPETVETKNPPARDNGPAEKTKMHLESEVKSAPRRGEGPKF
jgi:hypothetical protein